jgi:hypothetical protein
MPSSASAPTTTDSDSHCPIRAHVPHRFRDATSIADGCHGKRYVLRRPRASRDGAPLPGLDHPREARLRLRPPKRARRGRGPHRLRQPHRALPLRGRPTGRLPPPDALPLPAGTTSSTTTPRSPSPATTSSSSTSASTAATQATASSTGRTPRSPRSS